MIDERLTIAASSRDCSPPATKSEGPGLLPGPLICGDPNGSKHELITGSVQLAKGAAEAEPRRLTDAG